MTCAFSTPRQLHVEPLITMRKTLVIDPELMKDARLKVPHVNWIFDLYCTGNRPFAPHYSRFCLEVDLCAQLGEATKLNR